MTGIFLGTSSWDHAGWRGVFYPEGIARGDYLAYYGRSFCSVEVNTSFYALPEPGVLLKWVESVPAGFTFALKFPRSITHERRLVGCEREAAAFLDVLRTLGEAAGPALLQLPPGLTRQRDGRTLADFLEWLGGARGSLRIGVEVRAPDLMTSSFATYVVERGMTPVLADRLGAPDLYDTWGELAVMAGYAFVRWIGDNRNGPKGDREIVAPRDADLAKWAERLAGFQAAEVEVFGYVHNPYEGHAPATLRRLMQELEGRAVLPAWPPGEEPEAGRQLPLL
jgi:uncharacterized protein YecE (DUF72 family)